MLAVHSTVAVGICEDASAVDEPNEKKGLACPNCGCRHLEVYYTRDGLQIIKRVRICRHCGRRIPTQEKIVGQKPKD